MEPVFFLNQLEFRRWLEQNHEKETELIVGFYKVNSGKLNMTWSQSVDQALCFGWIDGVRRSIDEDSYCIRFTPRRSDSRWSALNISKVENLIKKGLMHPAGINKFKNRKEKYQGNNSSENRIQVLPLDYEHSFKGNRKAWIFFEAQPPSYRKNVIRWIFDARQEATRLRRLYKVIDECAAGRKLF